MKLRAAVVLVVCLAISALGASPALGVPLRATAWTDWMTSTLIAYDWIFDSTPDSWANPDVHGDWVVWQKTHDSAVDWNIYAYNLKTRAVKVVSEAAGNQSAPRVHGDWVVYTDNRWGNREIYAYNLVTNTEKRLTTRAGDQWDPDISGTKVVYDNATAGDIYVYDLAKGTDSRLLLDLGDHNDPRISGNRVVYQESGEIFVYDLTTGTVARLTNDAVSDGYPLIDGTLVAWSRNSDIWCQDLSGGAAAPAVATSDYEFPTGVSGTHVVFERRVGGTQYDLGVYDSRVDEYETLTDTTSDDILAAIDGPNIVWTSGWETAGTYGGNISLGRLVAPQLTARAGVGTIAYGAKTTISGSLSENGIALGGLTVAIDRSTNGGHTWGQVTTLAANSSGNYTYTTPALYTKTLYRARYNGAGAIGGGINRFSALSAPVTVNVRASLGRPAGYPSTGRKTKTYSVYGSLKPRQSVSAADAGVVVIKCYQRKSGRWKYRKTVNARVYNYDTYSRYKGGVKLPYSGRWRMRAYFKGSPTNAEKYSSWKYVSVE